MTDNQTTFLAKSEVKANDLEHKRKLAFNIQKYADTVVKGKQQFSNLDLARRRAKNVKWDAIENLDKYLIEFEKNFTARGGKVIWAEDAKEALEAVLQICQAKQARRVVKSKSMVTEEIHLNDYLAEHGIESVETDLGEYIQQLDGEAPYHIVTPAMHKSKEDVAKLFHNKLGVPPNLSPSELTQIARRNLREKYISSEVGITGGNFLIADTGAVCVTENEGNGRLSTAFPKTHIATRTRRSSDLLAATCHLWHRAERDRVQYHFYRSEAARRNRRTRRNVCDSAGQRENQSAADTRGT